MSTTNAEPTAQALTASDRGYYTIEGNRLVFDLSDEGLDFLNRLLRESGDSPMQLFRKALGLYSLALDARREGKYIGSVTDPEVLDTEFINK